MNPLEILLTLSLININKFPNKKNPILYISKPPTLGSQKTSVRDQFNLPKDMCCLLSHISFLGRFSIPDQGVVANVY